MIAFNSHGDTHSLFKAVLEFLRDFHVRVAKLEWLWFYLVSCCQPTNHGQDVIGYAFQLRINLSRWARWLGHVEMPVERYLVGDPGLIDVDPGIRRIGLVARTTTQPQA